jgi:hypothetical protein
MQMNPVSLATVPRWATLMAPSAHNNNMCVCMELQWCFVWWFSNRRVSLPPLWSGDPLRYLMFQHHELPAEVVHVEGKGGVGPCGGAPALVVAPNILAQDL